MSSGHYRLDGKQVVACGPVEWAEYFGKSNRMVAKTDTRGTRVSTVFLGLDHQYGDGPPLVFETMIFGGEHDDSQWRYSTWEEAEWHHHQIVDAIENCLPIPEPVMPPEARAALEKKQFEDAMDRIFLPGETDGQG